MSNNDNLTDLGVNIGNLVNLTNINFSNNSWLSFPANLESIPWIQWLTLNNNTNLASLNGGYNTSSSQVCEVLPAWNTCVEWNGTRVVISITP